MIQPKTLESLNYFLDEEILTCEENIKGNPYGSQLNIFYRGQRDGLKTAKMWINTDWIDENS